MSTTVDVQNISDNTSEKEVRDFFSFCGKIESISITPGTVRSGIKSATVTFSKESAARTALLLDNTQLGSTQVHVSSSASEEQTAGAKTAGHADEGTEDITQEDKPRSRILAEYLASGYVVSDKAIENALALDQKHGVSNRFMSALNTFDSKYKATEKAQQVDAKLGVSDRANYAYTSMNTYFEKAMETPTGQRLRNFYQQGNKQVMDVHNEARHLANAKTGKSDVSTVPGSDRTKCNCGADTGKCPCAPGKCACASCAKNPEESSSVSAESA